MYQHTYYTLSAYICGSPFRSLIFLEATYGPYILTHREDARSLHARRSPHHIHQTFHGSKQQGVDASNMHAQYCTIIALSIDLFRGFIGG